MTAGRNRNFDKEKALKEAMWVFWQNGFPGTSLSDLTSAMGINKSSLYAAFGNKEALFNQVIEYYLNKHGTIHSAELNKTKYSLKERIRNYLYSIAEMLSDPRLPKGCLICLSTSEMAGDCLPEDSIAKVTAINHETLASLTAFFDNEKQAGNVSDSLISKTMADYLLTLQFGLAVSARNGSDSEQLKATIELAIRGQFDD